MSYQGYTCSVCGQFVPYGSYHACGGTPNRTAAAQPAPITFSPNAAELRIAAAVVVLWPVAYALELLGRRQEARRVKLLADRWIG